MANYDKWSRGAAGHMCKHFERAKDEHGEYVKFGNKDIDTSRSHLNYNLAPERKSQYGFIADRCKELKCLNRKDVNVLASWVVTAPATLPDDKLRDFFQASYNALEKNYGKDNVVSAYVHMDESGRPHMHFAFVPVVWDKKKEAWKVSAKQCVTRTDLQNFHPWFQEELQKALGYKVDVINDATRDGNKTVSELKQERELQKQQEIAQETQKATQELLKVQDRVKTAQDELDALKEPVSDLRAMDEIVERAGKTITGKVARNKADDKMIVDAAKHGISADMQVRRLQDDLHRANDRCDRKDNQIATLERKLREERSKNIELQKEIDEMSTFKKFVLAVPNLYRQFTAWLEQHRAEQELKKAQELEKQKSRERSRTLHR